MKKPYERRNKKVMKKNRMMRSASALLVMVLLTTSVISGTFAKYTTAASAYDTARVAKWGVNLSVDGNLYGEKYVVGPDNKIATKDTDTITVETYNSTSVQQSIIAPGTKSADTGLAFTLDGTPEVSVALTGEVNATTTVLPAATYVIAAENQTVKGGEADTTVAQTISYKAEKSYYPVKYTLTKDGATVGTADSNLLEIAAQLIYVYGDDMAKTTSNELYTVKYADTAKTAQDYAPNNDLGKVANLTGEAGKYVLTWKYDFEDSTLGTSTTGIYNADILDTFLGDVAYAACGETGNTVTDTNVVCYKNAASDTFYTVGAYNAMSETDRADLTAVKYSELAGLNISIVEEFNLAMTVTQVD